MGVSPSDRPAPSPLIRHFALDPDVVFLNHGSFGACPLGVLEAQQELRLRMEREPVRFFTEDLPRRLDASREALAAFVRCRPDELVFVPNATTGVATVLQCLAETLDAGDEVLTTTHEYPACWNNLRRVAQRRRLRLVTADIPFPLTSCGDAVEAILTGVSSRTRLALISHVTSPTALVLPIRQLVTALESRGVTTIVDGAHAPGQVPDLHLAEISASFYVANAHKWMCAPKGAAFIRVRPDRQSLLQPLVLSNRAFRPIPGRKHLVTQFDYVGTADYTAWAVIPQAIETMGRMLAGGWPAVLARNHALACQARRWLCEALGTAPPAPDDILGAMASVLLPPHDPDRAERLARRPTRFHDALHDALVDRWSIQVPVWSVPSDVDPADLAEPAGPPATPPSGSGRSAVASRLGSSRPRLVRISAQVYNSEAQYHYLAWALREELVREGEM